MRVRACLEWLRKWLKGKSVLISVLMKGRVRYECADEWLMSVLRRVDGYESADERLSQVRL